MVDLTNLKDRTLSFTAREAINLYLKDLGKVLQLKIDSKRNSIEVEVLLAGEEKPIELTIGRYEICREGEKYYIVVGEIGSSRRWITALARRYLEGHRFEIPENLARILQLLT
ncbi:MAG: hypothetical protein GXO19_05495 [Epsilonproteobacteria bacterium]|nr:hypothetical protein [Campylobacterota bacterium]NPA57171.1 hypothetical protein [Campylobacterota bacterium]